jgi:hypothetical protein
MTGASEVGVEHHDDVLGAADRIGLYGSERIRDPEHRQHDRWVSKRRTTVRGLHGGAA